MPDAIDEAIFERQTRRYNGHSFTTVRGRQILINERATLYTAMCYLETVKRDRDELIKERSAATVAEFPEAADLLNR